MRLCVSNLAWDEARLDQALEAIAGTPSAGIEVAGIEVAGIEVAPGRLGGWDAALLGRVAAYRARLAGLGLAVPAMQAIFYGRPEAALLGDEAAFAAMLAHLRLVRAIGLELGADVAVFGAPATRRRGALDQAAAFTLAVERLRRVGDVLGPVRLAIEPVPATAHCDFIHTGAEALALVRAVDHPAIALQCDSAALAASGEDAAAHVIAAGAALAHVHASQPELGDFSVPLEVHAVMAAGLAARDWRGWVSVEMLGRGDEIARLRQAIAAVAAIYPVRRG